MQKTRWVGAKVRGAAVLVSCAFAGCAHYAARPLAPKRTLQTLQSRRLTDPQLLRHIREKTGRPESDARPPLHRGRAELLLAAMDLNPALAEARAQHEQASASLKTARAIQNPTLSVATEYDLSRAAESPWLWGIGTSFLLDTFAGRGVRVNLAQAGVRGANADFTDAVWADRAMARRRVGALLGAELSASEPESSEESDD